MPSWLNSLNKSYACSSREGQLIVESAWITDRIPDHGATAILWLWFLLHHPSRVVPAELRLDTINSAKLTLTVPFAYVLGMIIDFASILVTDALKWLLVQLHSSRIGFLKNGRLCPPQKQVSHPSP
jgi:hypothetical protein